MAIAVSGCQDTTGTETVDQADTVGSTDPDVSETPGDDGSAHDGGGSESHSEEDAPTTSHSAASADCPIPEGLAFLDGPVTRLADLGEVDGVRVEGALYPHPGYEGNPWSQWGQGLVIDDGRFYSAIGDHIGRDGNSYIYEYDPERGELAMVADILSFVDHDEGSWGYGKIHGQMVAGPCGEIYLSTYWGTSRGLEFGGSYDGDLLMRLDPHGRTLAPLEVPIDRHGQASLAGSAELGLVYGEAVDPIVRADGDSEGPFFAYDVRSGEVVYESGESHVGYRNVMVDTGGKAYFSTGDGRLAVYDPDTNDVGGHDHEMPGEWLRASTQPAPDGRVYGVTRDPDRFFVMEQSGEIEDLGEAAGYTASMAIAPAGDHFYYMPHAHGGAWQDGAPLIGVDGESGEQEIVVELNRLVEDGLGHTVGGTYNVAVGPDGKTVFLGVNASPLGDDGGFGEVILLVVHLP